MLKTALENPEDHCDVHSLRMNLVFFPKRKNSYLCFSSTFIIRSQGNQPLLVPDLRRSVIRPSNISNFENCASQHISVCVLLVLDSLRENAIPTQVISSISHISDIHKSDHTVTCNVMHQKPIEIQQVLDSLQ